MIKNKPSIGNDNDNDNEEPIILVVDASGLTVSKKGNYIEEILSSWMWSNQNAIMDCIGED